jgi:predicted glutamine amidotransferase
MCQLLGLSSNKEVDIQFSLKEFKKRGRKNPHGWGFAFFQRWETRIGLTVYSICFNALRL